VKWSHTSVVGYPRNGAPNAERHRAHHGRSDERDSPGGKRPWSIRRLVSAAPRASARLLARIASGGGLRDES